MLKYQNFWIERLRNIKVANNNHINGDCPICDDTKRHFYANIETGAWDCKKCQASGNIITYLRKYEHLDNRQIAQKLKKEDINNPLQNNHVNTKRKEFNKDLISYYLTNLKEKQLVELSKERGLRISTLLRHKIGMDKYGNYTVPIYDNNKTIRNILRKKPGGATISSKGGEALLFGIEDLLKPQDNIFVVEGAWSAMALKERGYPAVGTSGAGILKEEQVPYFKNKNVILMPDLDPAGFRGVTKIQEKLRDTAQTVKIFDMTEKIGEKQDIRDFFKNGGTTKEFDSLIQEKQHIDEKPINIATTKTSKFPLKINTYAIQQNPDPLTEAVIDIIIQDTLIICGFEILKQQDDSLTVFIPKTKMETSEWTDNIHVLEENKEGFEIAILESYREAVKENFSEIAEELSCHTQVTKETEYGLKLSNG